ncbi:hypothetical protein ACWF94_28130 [Streptomyces sp. NPDC055078]
MAHDRPEVMPPSAADTVRAGLLHTLYAVDERWHRFYFAALYRLDVRPMARLVHRGENRACRER